MRIFDPGVRIGIADRRNGLRAYSATAAAEQEQLLVLPQLAYLPVSIVFVVIVVVGTLL